MSNFKIAMRCQEHFINLRPTFSKGNANPPKMPVTLVALSVFGLSTTPSLYKIQVHRPHTERATRARQAWPKKGHLVWVCIAF